MYTSKDIFIYVYISKETKINIEVIGTIFLYRKKRNIKSIEMSVKRNKYNPFRFHEN